MSFCVGCGATIRTFKGLCPRCFAEKHRLIEPPATIDLVRCTACSRLLIGKSWIKNDIDEAIPSLLEKSVPTSREVTFKAFSFVSRQEDERNLMLSVRATLRVDDFEVRRDFSTRLRIQGGTCPTCGKKTGHYYESILQIRADGRELTPQEETDITRFVEEWVNRAESKGEAFISKIEPVRGGFDFYLSSHDLGRNIAKELRARYGGEVDVSPKIFGRIDGRDVYRTTHLIRIPRYRQGDVVRIGGRLFEILRLGVRPHLRNLETGERASAKIGELEHAKFVPSDRFTAKVLRISENEVEYQDPVNDKPASTSRPPGLDNPVEVDIVSTEGGSFISMLGTETRTR